MAKKFKFCIHCRRLILESEISAGAYVTTRYGMLCQSCAERLDENPESQTPQVQPPPQAEKPAPEPPPKPRKTAEVVERAEAEPATKPVLVPEEPPAAPAKSAAPPPILPDEKYDKIMQKLDMVQQGQMFERSSSWTVVAAVAQTLAGFILLLGVLNWNSGPQNMLLAAIVFQLMALTFFYKAR